MKITRKNLNILIERMLFEDLGEVVYKYENGEYSHKKGEDKDPYTYKVVGGSKGTDINVKITKVGKGKGQKMAKVGAQFKIKKQNLFNPNVQSLYAAIVENQPEYRIKGDSDRRPREGGEGSGARSSNARDFVAHKDINSLRTALALQYKNVKKGDSRLFKGKNNYVEGELKKGDVISGEASLDSAVFFSLGLKAFPPSGLAKLDNARNQGGGKIEDFTSTINSVIDALKPADVVYVGHLLPKKQNDKHSNVYVEVLAKVDQRDFAIIRVGDVNFDHTKTGGESNKSSKNIASTKDGPSGLGTDAGGVGSMAIKESFGRKEMKSFMRGLLNEAYEEGTPGTERDPKNKSAIKIENKTSSTGAENKVFVMLRDTLKPAKIDNVYYIWDQWDQYWDGAPQELGKRGSEYGISEDSDPYTYSKEGNMYRVVSGPKPGPIGKTFKPKSKNIGSTKDDDIIDDIEEIFNAYEFGCKPDSVQQYKEKMTSLAVQALKSGDATKLFEEIPQAVDMYRGKNATSWSLPDNTKWVWLFSTSCAGDYAKAASVYQDVLDALEVRGVTKSLLPFPKGSPISGTVSEGLSRGSLYRRRYHGRY